MANQRYWILVAALILLVVISMIKNSYIMDIIQADEAQRAQHECKSYIPKCDPKAYCYGNDTSYECMCISGWDGDGFVGDGHSGCQKRQDSKSQQAAYIIVYILTALLTLWCFAAAMLGCMRLTARNRALMGLAQQAYPHQEVVPSVAVAV